MVWVPITTTVNADQLESAFMSRNMYTTTPLDSNEFNVLLNNLAYDLLLYLKNIIQDNTAYYEHIDACTW